MESKKFDPKKLAKLNDPQRLERENPDLIWDALGLKSPQVVVDIGAGTGFFAVPFSRRMPGGTVYACDLSAEMIAWMESHLPPEALVAVKPLLMQENRVPLPDGLADLVVMINLHHELDAPVTLLREALRLLKPGGKVAVIDWKDQAMEIGPPLEHRLSRVVIRGHLQAAGFAHLVDHDLLPYHVFLVGEKS